MNFHSAGHQTCHVCPAQLGKINDCSFVLPFNGSQIYPHKEQLSQNGIHSVPTVGGQPSLVTPAGRDSAPAASPVDPRFAYIINAAASSTMIVFDHSGLVQAPLPEKAFDVAWSPDGSRLAVSGQATGKLYIIDTSNGTVLSAIGNRVRRRLSWSLDPTPPTSAGNNVVVGFGSVDLTFANVDTAGRGIGRALLTLTDMNGVSRTTMSNTFGYYSFVTASAGQSYVLTVESGRYTFTENPRFINAQSDVTGVDFIGQR